MEITETRIARIFVEGRVQGVGYRVFVAREAGDYILTAGCATAAMARWRPSSPVARTPSRIF
jgi:hypothetical protein